MALKKIFFCLSVLVIFNCLADPNVEFQERKKLHAIGDGKRNWGDNYNLFQKPSPPSDHLVTKKRKRSNNDSFCTTYRPPFTSESAARKQIDKKNIFPGLSFIDEKESAERSHSHVNARYKVEFVEIDNRHSCAVYFDNKYIGYYAPRLASKYIDSFREFQSLGFKKIDEIRDCDKPCLNRFRVYTLENGESQAVVLVYPYGKQFHFVYSNVKMNEVRDLVGQ